jgi:hypothetical protein
MSNKADHS